MMKVKMIVGNHRYVNVEHLHQPRRRVKTKKSNEKKRKLKNARHHRIRLINESRKNQRNPNEHDQLLFQVRVHRHP